jgi:hypothetical protein
MAFSVAIWPAVTANGWPCRRCVRPAPVVVKRQVTEVVQFVDLVVPTLPNVFYSLAPVAATPVVGGYAQPAQPAQSAVQPRAVANPLDDASPELIAEFRQFLQWKVAGADRESVGHPPDADRPALDHLPVTSASCIRCHGGEQPKANIDLSIPINHETLGRVIVALATDHMPPESAKLTLTAAEKDAIRNELIANLEAD